MPGAISHWLLKAKFMFLEKCLHDVSFEVKIVTSCDWTKGPLQRPLYEQQDHINQLVTKTLVFHNFFA